MKQADATPPGSSELASEVFSHISSWLIYDSGLDPQLLWASISPHREPGGY